MFSFFKKSKSRNKDSKKDKKQQSTPVEPLNATNNVNQVVVARACATTPLHGGERSSQIDGDCTSQLVAENKHHEQNTANSSGSNDVTACERTSFDTNARSNCSNLKSASNFFDIMAKGRNKRHQNNNKNTNNKVANKSQSPATGFPTNNGNKKCSIPNEMSVSCENFPNDVNHQTAECQIDGDSHKNVMSTDENKSKECENTDESNRPTIAVFDALHQTTINDDVIEKSEGEIGGETKATESVSLANSHTTIDEENNSPDVGGNSTADFVKELVFQKYKNCQHQTPIYVQSEQLSPRPQQAEVVENLNFVEPCLNDLNCAADDDLIMGQPPSKSSNANSHRQSQIQPQPPSRASRPTSPPTVGVVASSPVQAIPGSLPPPSVLTKSPSPTHSKKSVTFATPLEDSIFIPSLRDHESSPDDYYYEADGGPDDTDDNSDLEELASDDDDDDEEEEGEDEDEEEEPTEIPSLNDQSSGNFKEATAKRSNFEEESSSLETNQIAATTNLNEINKNNNQSLCLRNKDVKIKIGENAENENDDDESTLVNNSFKNNNNNTKFKNNNSNDSCVGVSEENDEENSQNCDNAFILKTRISHSANDDDVVQTNGISFSDTCGSSDSINQYGNGHASSAVDEKDDDNKNKMMVVARKPGYAEDTVSLPDVVESNSILLHGPEAAKMLAVSEEKMRDLVNQESRYAAKIEAAETKAAESQHKVDELMSKIEMLDKDLADKTWNVDRLQGEWESAIKEGDCMRRKAENQKNEIEKMKQQGFDAEEEMKQKIEELVMQNNTTEAKLNAQKTVINSLQDKIIVLDKETEDLKSEKERLEDERKAEQKIIQDALETAVSEREQLEAKWKKEFEELRNHHTDREEHLMEDCEWQLRQMQKQCKDKIEKSEKERTAAIKQVELISQESAECRNEIVKFKSFEVEVNQLRGITKDQKDQLHMMTRQIEELRIELEAANIRLEIELENVKMIKRKCANDISDKERQTLFTIETQRNEISTLWERRLFEEMDRLKTELEQIHAEERHSALEKLKDEMMEDAAEMTNRFNMREKQLWEEIEALKERLSTKCHELVEAQTSRDRQIIESRKFVERAQRNHQTELDAEIRDRETAIEELKEEHEHYKEELEESFTKRILQVQEEFSRELTDSTDALKKKHKKELDVQYKNLIAEKDQALQSMEQKYRTKLDAAESKLNFEEMRMRYERRDPRPEDLQQIDELKSVVDSQDRDLRILTERLREIQMSQEPGSEPQGGAPPRKTKVRGKAQPPPQLDLQRVVQPSSQQQQPIQPRLVPQSPTKSPGLKPNIEVIFEENENDENGREVQTSNREVIATEF